MKNIKEKRINIKNFFGIFLMLFFALIFFLSFFNKKEKNENLDYKLGIIANDGIVLVSISNERRMINKLNLGQDVEVFIPNGMSWYKNNKIKNILEQEKKIEVSKDIFWYNFGFLPDKILVLNSVDQWQGNRILINNLGIFNWLKYKKDYGKMLFKQEKIDGNLSENELFLDEIMVRDFSESKLNNEELRLSIFNNTNESGLADFIAKRLEWSGFSIVSIDNNSEKVNKCLIIYGNKTDLNYGWKIINQIFDCDKKKDETLNDNELQLYFGDNFASMIKYSEYTK